MLSELIFLIVILWSYIVLKHSHLIVLSVCLQTSDKEVAAVLWAEEQADSIRGCKTVKLS